MRIAVVADSHLAPDANAFNRNWRAVREYVAALGADLTVHLGDVTVDGLGDPAQLDHARALGADWPTPIRYVPGNHDIGDNPPGPGIAAKHPLEPARIGAFRAALGPDYWALDADGWRVIALNAQLIGTGTRDEAEQWSWLLWPLLVSTDKLMKTLPVGMQEFVSLEGGTNWGPLMAAASMAVLPALLAYVVAQRYVLESFVTAGLKE